MNKQKVYYRLFFDLFLSKSLCLICGLHSAPNELICAGCKADLPWLQDHCKQCAQPLPCQPLSCAQLPSKKSIEAHKSGSSSQIICGRCLKDPPAFDSTLVPFQYEQPIKQLVTSLKNKGQLDTIELAAQLFTEHLKDRISHQPPQLIVPVPLHLKRLYSRGYNQATELASRLSQILDIPCDKRSCRRILNTPHQQGLNATARRQNLRHCFNIAATFQAERVAIVDDVMTTGSTVNALAYKLKEAGVSHVEIWCFARTPTR